MSAGIALRLAEALPQTADNWRALGELIQVLRNDLNDEEKRDDE